MDVREQRPRARRKVLWLTVGILVLAAIGIGIFYLVNALNSDDTGASGDRGDAVGRYPVHVGDKWGYIDATGKLVIPPRFREVHPFSDGLAMVWASDFHGFIDAGGNKVIDLQGYVEAHDFSEGLAVVGQLEGDQGYYGYVDKTGYWVIQPTYEHAGSFSEGLAAVELETSHGLLYGYIDRTGKVVIQPRFKGAGEFHEGLAVVDDWELNQPMTCGYIDKSGTMVIGMHFNAAMEFSGGLAAAHPLDAGWGYIDETGAFVIQLRYGDGWASPDSFTPGGLVRVNLDNSGMLDGFGGQPQPPWAYIDKTGKIVWQRK